MSQQNTGTKPIGALLICLRNTFASQNRKISSLKKSLLLQRKRCDTLSQQLADKNSMIKSLQLRLTHTGKVTGASLIEEIIGVVAEVCQVEISVFRNVKKGSNQRSQTWPRQLAMCLCQEYEAGTSLVVAKAFNRKDHSTALFAKKAVYADIIQSRGKKLQYDLCRQRLDELLHIREASAGGGTCEP